VGFLIRGAYGLPSTLYLPAEISVGVIPSAANATEWSSCASHTPVVAPAAPKVDLSGSQTLEALYFLDAAEVGQNIDQRQFAQRSIGVRRGMRAVVFLTEARSTKHGTTRSLARRDLVP